MLRLPRFELHRPTSVDEAVALLAEPDALPLAGGTDLLPNMKHRIATPRSLVALSEIAELRGIRTDKDGTLVIGAMTPLDEVAASDVVQKHAPALAQAAGLVSGPQLRHMGTLGGNVMLDTRCRYINQTHFWRQSLGFCLKKDGTKCHVVESGRKCVAALETDTVPVLCTLGGSLMLVRRGTARTVAVDGFYKPDGIAHRGVEPGELLTEIRVPKQAPGHRGAYGKLRDRGSIDFPLLGVAVRVDLDGGKIADADVVVGALQARPVRIKGAADALRGVDAKAAAGPIDVVAAQAWKQCHPMPNIPGDPGYRREMVPVFVKRTLAAALA
jgi:4-hydroxybenzoyl-CoA reductase subunit beta